MNKSEDTKNELLKEKSSFNQSTVFRQGEVLIKDAKPWSPSVHAFLRHLEEKGFKHAPTVIASGFDSEGNETLSFIEGNFIDPGPWSIDAAYQIGVMLKELHVAGESFKAPRDAIWQPYFARDLTQSTKLTYGHGDVASWNIVARDGLPYAFIDWEYAGPIDPMIELAQCCWLNAKLHDDVVAEIEGLGSVKDRADRLRAIIDGYGLSKEERVGFVDRIIEFVIHATANEADVADLRIDTHMDVLDEQVPWALAWRARAASWILKNRSTLQNSLTKAL